MIKEKTNDWECVLESCGWLDEWIPEGMTLVHEPAFGVDIKTGDLLTGMEDLPADRKVVNVVDVVYVRLTDVPDPQFTHEGAAYYDLSPRGKIVMAALSGVASSGWRFVFSVAVRGSGTGNSAVRVVKVRCAR